MTAACSKTEDHTVAPATPAASPTAPPQITSGTTKPEGFPSGIPIMSDAKITEGMKRVSADKTTYLVTYETKTNIQDLRAAYMGYLQSEQYLDIGNMGTEHTAVMSGTLDDGKKSLAVTITELENHMQVTVQYIEPTTK